MDDQVSGFFREMRIAILGLGLMGGSLALALKGKCASLLGIDPDQAAVKLAVENKIVDLASSDPTALLPTADLIILAAPVRAILSLLHELPALHSAPAAVIDLGSTKAAVLEAMAALPERFDPIGGHPICGKEQASLVYADGRLFQGAPFVFTPLPRSSARVKQIAAQLALAVGAQPLWMDADAHDRMVAATSHFPFLVSNALAAATPLDAAFLTGPGFQSATRLATSSPEMMIDILITNRENILGAMSAFQERLTQIENLLRCGEFERLRGLLREGAEKKQAILASKGALP